ncbi:inactive serine/threonine-protein kinase PLK5 isoform X3 [Saimiri boliviensis]|uniref:inactive serine/threonine-protein kinase PLK5 isoform X3 n=1 Tax=Saimiri boliviensis TaxID=27679 RepID=UPI003D7773F2
MEPGPRRRRRRRSRPLVAAFLRDPGSGRVYRRGKLIGTGAFSRCYKLTDMSTSAVFALKVVPRGGAGAGWLRPRGKVEREIALHSRLRHRNIVAFHGHFADHDHVYMVLEYCSRQSLAHVLRARQTLTEPEVRYYLRGLVSGLRYLHQRRIVHRDLKLSNFFLNKNMEVKIGDLGLAAKVGPEGRCHRVLCGTPNFLAPEVVSRNGHSCQSDIWALGCVMYTVLTGTPPFTASPLSEMYQNIREGRYPEPAHLSPSARRLIARLLAPNPAERPSLEHLLRDDFFTQGFTPDRLPAHSCHSPPIFTAPPPLGRIFRKVGQLLLTQCRPPCPFTPKEASGPGEDGPNPDSMEWGGKSSLTAKGVPCLEAPVHLIAQGTLQSDLAGPEGSRHPEVEAALRHLQLCVDTGPLAKCATCRPEGGWKPSPWGTCRGCWAFRSSSPGACSGGCGSRVRPQEGPLPSPIPPAGPGLCLLHFLASEQALLLLLSNGTVQMSFNGVPAQLLLSGEGEGLQLTLWERGPPGTSSSLDVLRNHGCVPATRQRLHHALRMLQSI